MCAIAAGTILLDLPTVRQPTSRTHETYQRIRHVRPLLQHVFCIKLVSQDVRGRTATIVDMLAISTPEILERMVARVVHERVLRSTPHADPHAVCEIDTIVSPNNATVWVVRPVIVFNCGFGTDGVLQICFQAARRLWACVWWWWGGEREESVHLGAKSFE